MAPDRAVKRGSRRADGLVGRQVGRRQEDPVSRTTTLALALAAALLGTAGTLPAQAGPSQPADAQPAPNRTVDVQPAGAQPGQPVAGARWPAPTS
jgi:hypothetical protein